MVIGFYRPEKLAKLTGPKGTVQELTIGQALLAQEIKGIAQRRGLWPDGIMHPLDILAESWPTCPGPGWTAAMVDVWVAADRTQARRQWAGEKTVATLRLIRDFQRRCRDARRIEHRPDDAHSD